MLVPQSLLRLQGMFDIYFKSFIHVDRVLLRWEAEAHTSISFSVPDNWMAGVLWDPVQQSGESSIVVDQYRECEAETSNGQLGFPSILASQALLHPTGNPVALKGPASWEGPK